MLDRPRSVPLAWAAGSFVVFGMLAWLVTGNRAPLGGLDEWGSDAASWAYGYPALVDLLHIVEEIFNTIPMIIYTAIIAGLLLYNSHRRAAVYTVGVMLSTTLATSAIKLLVGRDRPEWQDPLDLLDSKSFPSGHASSTTALMMVLVVLASVFVRRGGLRRLAYVGAAAVVVLVCLDRVLLGRHYPTDVLAGVALGVGMAFLWIALWNPMPRGHAVKEEPLPEVFVSEKQLAVVLNPIKVEDAGQFRSIVSTMARESGWSEPVWHYTTVEDPGGGMAEEAAVAGADLVLVCGGDGTVREVCAELAGTGVPIGIVPAGTGNLLARNLDIPLYIRSAIDVALNGQDRAIDMVQVTGDGLDDTHFMVMAGMGFDAALMEGVNEDIKKRIGWIAYIISGLKSLMFPAVRVEITVDDEPPTMHRARTVVVGNVGYLQAGMPLLPDAAIDDGLLDVVILHPKRFLSWIPLALRVLSKSSSTDELIDRRTGARITLRTHGETPRQLDGDAIGPGRELVMECLPGRLLVRVPR